MKIYKIAQVEGVTYEWPTITFLKGDDGKGSSHSWRIIAKIGDNTIGGVCGEKIVNDKDYWGKTRHGGTYLMIDHQYVRDDYKRQGIATEMFRKIVERYPGIPFVFSGLSSEGAMLVQGLVAKGIIKMAPP